MAKFGETLVSDFLSQLGLKPIKINEGDEQTPDFEVKNMINDELLFYLEEKTIDPDSFLENVEPGIIIDGNDTSENALEKKFRKAVKQFKSVNENHIKPNVLAFVNLNDMVNSHDLYISLTGTGLTENGKVIPFRRVGRVKDDIEHVDLCLWFGKEGLQNVLWMPSSEEHKETLKQLLRL
ncbi:hypothetical protein M3649_21225 [Ureibacillus chungkukjangi]|uniref:hypothetical protein n=1 Tax=Ureibacillus chungkukjangi TaxID=1202712 RepID=UPI00203D3D6D|nr:hypothetical protein [Ureibacillus chungkukjangi]MCM3390609.1 hypothetical protein [Ureibacillus chungkukjangi]